MTNQPKLKLRYDKPAPTVYDYDFARQNDSPEAGWEKWSLPLGNGFFGASIFGRVGRERIQITENSLCNPPLRGSHWRDGSGGLRSFCDVILEFPHDDVTDYSRGLDIDGALADVEYTCGGVRYEREYFTSYPDRVLVVRLSASRAGALSFDCSLYDPFLRDYCIKEGDGCGKSATFSGEGNILSESGVSHYYNILFEARLAVLNFGGELKNENGKISVSGADSAVLLFTCGTNYRLESRVFTESDPKKKLAPYPHPHEMLCRILRDAEALGYDELKRRHTADYTALFSRVKLNLNCDIPDMTTDRLLLRYKSGEATAEERRYLEMLLCQYGRYLLISSSRKGTLPANLQGVWDAYDSSPWTCDYHHNINVQMNYWCACAANMAETFSAYSDYAAAYMAEARACADEYIRKISPEKALPDGENGWIIATGASPYHLDHGLGNPNNHSGPGTGGFTSLLFWDYYDYTRDGEYLEKVAYPYLRDMSRCLLLALEERDGKYLAKVSASPEQQGADGKYYVTVGCAFDQQMIYENFRRTLEAAEILGAREPILDEIRERIDMLDPVLIGADGQVKEFREEEHYGDIGEYCHRHISQLVGLYPGTLINKTTPEWMEGAKVTLTRRSDKSTGWAAAHRLCLWARTGNGNRAHDLLASMLKNNILPNLWDTHPPFQIDGNFGACAGICEMLLQSHAGYADVLAAIPDEWESGSFDGLVARGSFVIGATWSGGKITEIRIKSRVGGKLTLRANGLQSAKSEKEFTITADGMISAETSAGEEFTITFANNTNV